MASICVEVDLSKPYVQQIRLGINGDILVQKVVYENLPKYCCDCKHLGHSEDECFENGSREKPKNIRREKDKDDAAHKEKKNERNGKGPTLEYRPVIRKDKKIVEEPDDPD